MWMTRNLRSPRPLIWATLLLGSVLAAQVTSLSAQLAAMSGTGLTIAQCRDRMQNLGTLLGRAGYSPGRTQTMSDGTLAARWYNRTANRTVVAFSGQNAVGNIFTVSEQDGPVRWSDLLVVP